MASIYTPTERAILCDYFTIERSNNLRDINIHIECPGVYVRRSRFADEFELPAAVARIALKRIQNQLPVWACAGEDGEYQVSRNYERNDTGDTALMPIYLCMINWADSGPGFSWPEAYYLTWFPEFDRYVLTASQDSTDSYGFEDIAIGYAPFAQDRKWIAKKLLTGWWCDQRRYNDAQEWECLFGAGFVTENEAFEWREEIWPDYIDEV